MQKKLLGHVIVDSGQIIIADPAHLRRRWSADPAGRYNECGQASDAGGGQVLDGLAVAAPIGYGDGSYRVFGHLNEEGRISRITIEFDE